MKCHRNLVFLNSYNSKASQKENRGREKNVDEQAEQIRHCSRSEVISIACFLGDSEILLHENMFAFFGNSCSRLQSF